MKLGACLNLEAIRLVLRRRNSFCADRSSTRLPTSFRPVTNMNTPSIYPLLSPAFTGMSNLNPFSPLRGIPMRFLVPATHVAAFTSFARTTSRAARQAALLLFSVAVLLAGGAAAVRGQSALDGFDPNANGPVQRRRRAAGRQDSYRRRFYHALAQRRSGGHAQPHCPAEPGRHARHRLQPERERCCQCNRGAGGRQDFGGRLFHQHRRTDAQPHRPARCRTTGLADSFDPNANSAVRAIAVQADGKILAGGQFHEHRRTDAQPHRPARCHDRLG